MKQIELRTVIHEMDDFSQLIREFSLEENDLIFTNKYIFDPVIAPHHPPCRTIFQEEYGAGEPTDLMVDGILQEMKKFPCKHIIAVGGGTVLDIAKILSLSNQTDSIYDLLDHQESLASHHELIAVPTTCGTGSEVTNVAVVSYTRRGFKKGLYSEAMYPAQAVLISEFMETLPYKVFATSSIDALVHAAESYVGRRATPYTRLFSAEAIREILASYLVIARDHEQYKSRGRELLRASNYAGIAFQTGGLGLVHALSYAFSVECHVPHGESNYQFFAATLRKYKELDPSGPIHELELLLLELLAEAYPGRDGFAALEALLEDILPLKPMSEYGTPQQSLQPYTDNTWGNQQHLLINCPVEITPQIIREIYEERL